MMREVHNDPEFAALLSGPDGNAVPEEFPVPEDAYEGEICAVTGHKPGTGETSEEWLVRGQGPDQACGDVTDWERKQLEEAIAATRTATPAGQATPSTASPAMPRPSASAASGSRKTNRRNHRMAVANRMAATNKSYRLSKSTTNLTILR